MARGVSLFGLGKFLIFFSYVIRVSVLLVAEVSYIFSYICHELASLRVLKYPEILAFLGLRQCQDFRILSQRPSAH